jgi:hypothetical protein
MIVLTPNEGNCDWNVCFNGGITVYRNLIIKKSIEFRLRSQQLPLFLKVKKRLYRKRQGMCFKTLNNLSFWGIGAFLTALTQQDELFRLRISLSFHEFLHIKSATRNQGHKLSDTIFVKELQFT